MDSRAPLAEITIQVALERFLRDRSEALPPPELRLYRHVLFFLALCVNNYAHRNLDLEERDLCEKHRYAAFGAERDFFEIFPPEKLLPEIDFFLDRFLVKDVHTSSRVVGRAPGVVEDLVGWLVESGYVREECVAAERARARLRSLAADRGRRWTRRLGSRLLAVDREGLASRDYVPDDHHVVVRVQPGKIWLRVYRSAEAEDVGPVLVPSDVARGLRAGSSVRCALGRVRGRWHFVELSEILPQG